MERVAAEELTKERLSLLFTQSGVVKRKRGQRRGATRAASGGASRDYINLITAFDIETTNLPYPTLDPRTSYHSLMYVWTWAFGLDLIVQGRTWPEFVSLANRIVDVLSTPDTQTLHLVIYVHNLSFDGFYISGVLPLNPEDIFYIKPRKILTMRYAGHLEFRCSYIHSNMSLAEWARKLNASHQKLSGEDYDYTKPRYPWTPLTEHEQAYIINDVLAIIDCIQIELVHDNDTLLTIPLTSTGYLRREARGALASKREALRALDPSAELYTQLRRAFRGGDTHANRHYAGIILENVHSDDRSSSYPDVQCNELFPVTPFQSKGELTWAEFLDLKSRGFALLCDLELWDVDLQDPLWGFPYIPRDKLIEFEPPSGGGWYDNGRILRASYLKMTVTDIDLEIIDEQYTNQGIRLTNCQTSRYGPMPTEYTDIMRKYYKQKTELKGVAGEEIQYMKSKNRINSGYGMSAQDPGKARIYSHYDGERITYAPETAELPELLKKFKSVMPYQWGVWTTALARRELYYMQKAVHPYGVYSDTDSVKHLKRCQAELAQYNRRRLELSTATHCYAQDTRGKTHYMGECEYEGRYDRFITLGAKKYADEKDGRVEITVAGVNKRKGSEEVAAAGGLEAFKPGFIFRQGGGTEVQYNDKLEYARFVYAGQEYAITRNVVIRPSTYELGITAEYGELIAYGVV